MMAKDNRLKNAIRLSLALHIGVIFVLYLKNTVMPDETVVILPSLKVDLVALPDQKKNELVLPPPPVPSTAPEKPKPPVEPQKKPELALEPEHTHHADFSVSHPKKKKSHSKKEKEAQKKLKQALDRIRAIERIKALTGADPVKGNSLSKGSSLSGAAKKALESNYFDVVLERVRTYWELPKWLRDQNRAAKVMVYLDGQGRLKSFEFIQPSGSEPFDAEVKRTLQAAAPFPIPPGGISSDLSKQGILLGFPL
jgi:TonB family protein